MEETQSTEGAQEEQAQVHARAQRVKVDRGLVESMILSNLRYSAVRWWENQVWLDRGMETYRYLAGRSFDHGKRDYTHVPLFLALDLTALIELGERAPFASEGRAHTWPEDERRVRVDYENLLLGTLLQESSFNEARDRLPSDPRVRPGAVMRFAEILLQSFAPHFPDWFVLDPAHLRDIAVPTVADISVEQHGERLAERLEHPVFFLEGMKAMLSGISSEVYWKELLKEEDLFELENWAVLDSEATRIGVRQIAEVERRLGEFRLPRVRLRDEAMEVETDFADDTTFPTGGFSGLVNRGSFENLVRSELVYMGDATDPEISLFELRFVESELLFYMRNDGVMRRKRRFVHVIIDLDDAFHYKSPGYEYPFSTLSQGLITRLTRDLLETFEEDAVTVHIHYLYDPPTGRDLETARRERQRVEREMQLVSLMLGREVRQERVHVEMVKSLELEDIQHGRGRVYAIGLCFDERSERAWRARFDELEHARPPVLGLTLPIGVAKVSDEALEGEVPLVLPLAELPFQDVAGIKNELFSRIMSGRR